MGMGLVGIRVLMFVFNLINRVEIPDMTSWNTSEACAWSKKNDITLIGIQSYSITVDTDLVMSQGIKAGEKVKKNTSLEVEFSKGANPDESIVFPEVKTMILEDIQSWVKTTN